MFSWYEDSASSTICVYTSHYGRLAKDVASQRMISVACKLEKHYLIHNVYPNFLSDLQLEDESVLMDPYRHKIIQYKIGADDTSFNLFSVGLSQVMKELMEPNRN